MDRLDLWFKLAAAFVAATWLSLTPLVQVLIIFMGLDIATGLLAGYVARQLSSEISFRGMAKKAIVLILVGGAGLLEPHAGGLPLGQAIAGFYLANELLSIIENASKAGLPVPKILRDALAKLSPEQL